MKIYFVFVDKNIFSTKKLSESFEANNLKQSIINLMLKTKI